MYRSVILVLLALSIAAPRLLAQDAPAAAGTAMSAHGSVDVGYRFSDVNGNEDTFRQLFDLSEGVRLFGADLRATGGDSPRRVFDTLNFETSGLGGDPFPSVLVRARRSKLYDLRASWRRIRFFDVSPLTPASIDGFDTQAVTDRHAWLTSRRLGHIALTMTPTPRLQFLFGYDRMSRDGSVTSTRVVDFAGSPATWGSFARANPFLVSGPVEDASNQVTGGVSYGRDRWTVHYKAGYQSYDEHVTFDPLAVPERSINVADAGTSGESLSAITWNQRRTLTTPSSEVAFVVRPSSSFEWRGEYFYYRARGPVSLDAVLAGVARTNSTGTATSPYRVTIASNGTGEAPSHVAGEGFTYRPSLMWGVDVDYRYSRITSTTDGVLTSALLGYPPATATVPANASEEQTINWKQTQHTVRVFASIRPTSTLTLRPGVRFARRDVSESDDGINNPGTTHDDNTVTPELTVSYRPRLWLDVKGVYRHFSNDAAYTRMSPSDRDVAHLGITITPTEALSLTASVDRNTATLNEAAFESRIQGASLQASYVVDERVTAFGSIDYRRLFATGDTTFLRGTAPITNVVMQDRETDRVWQGGVTLRVTAAFAITATGIYDQVLGTDSITGEPPLYGPLSFPLGTVSASYQVPRLGKISLDVQRTHYYQDLLPLNDFRASMVTLHLTRGF